MTHTVAADVHINHIADADIDDAEKALVLLLEFLLVENLNGQNAVFRRFPAIPSATVHRIRLSSARTCQRPHSSKGSGSS